MVVVVPGSTTYTPGSKPLSTMCEEAAAFHQVNGADAQIATLCRSAINAGIGLINSRDWKKVYGVWTITLTQDQDYEEVQQDYKAPMSMHRLDTNSKRESRVRYEPLQTFLRQNLDSTQSGDICFYTFDEKRRRVMWDVPVGSAYIGQTPKHEHYYHRRVPSLQDDSDTTGLPPEFDEWLVLRAALRLGRILDPEKIRFISEEEREMWQWIRTSDNQTESDAL